MKRIILITIALISLSSFAFAQEGQQKSLIIINGMFFSEKPEPTPCDVPIQMGVLKDEEFGERLMISTKADTSELSSNIRAAKAILCSYNEVSIRINAHTYCFSGIYNLQ